jgi:RNA polymerase sigma factor (TIGR02999 family)
MLKRRISPLEGYRKEPLHLTDDVTEWLLAWNAGDEGALTQLVERVYEDLHRLAAGFFAGEPRPHLLQPTALIHETYLRLIDQSRVQWQNRAHFFAIAARLMRRILVDHARQRYAAKRGGTAITLSLDESLGVPAAPEIDFQALDLALEGLTQFAPRQSRIVELRFFGGLTIPETAEVLNVSSGTVKLDWQMARAWLRRELRP